jgi:GNAT superfamily N-acetyltransferase
MDAVNIPALPAEHPVRHNDGGERRIIFVTDPENQLTTILKSFGEAFFQEGKLPGKFHVEHWLKQWTLLIRAKLGYMWVMVQNDAVIGGIGMLIAPDLCDGELVMQEAFWYVGKEYRGGTGGVRLLREVEQFAKAAGVSRIILGRLHASDPDLKVAGLLERMGYAAIETNYFKIICQDV